MSRRLRALISDTLVLVDYSFYGLFQGGRRRYFLGHHPFSHGCVTWIGSTTRAPDHRSATRVLYVFRKLDAEIV